MSTETQAILLLTAILVALAVALVLAAQTELRVCEFVVEACQNGEIGGTE